MRKNCSCLQIYTEISKFLDMAEFIDKGFQPQIDRFLDKEQKSFFDVWAMPTTGVSVPSEHLSRVAVFWGENLTKLGEFAIIALVMKHDGRLRSEYGAYWYCGVGNRDELIDAERPLIAVRDAATCPAADMTAIIDNIRCLLPEREYADSVDRLPSRQDILFSRTTSKP